jgi:hypothetical protein
VHFSPPRAQTADDAAPRQNLIVIKGSPSDTSVDLRDRPFPDARSAAPRGRRRKFVSIGIG